VKGLVAISFVLAALGSGLLHAQFGGRRQSFRIPDNEPPQTEFIASRWHFGTNGAIGHMGWSHNYPDAEIHLNEFLGRTTRIDVADESFRLLELDSPEIFEYPFAYISEPGEMEMTEAEVENLREYVRRGGFVLIDDFDTWHMDNLREEMSRVFPGKIFEQLAPEHPILDVIFTVADLERMGEYVAGDEPVYYAMTNDLGEIAVIALHNNDLANFWEWYGSPQYPLEPSTDAFRLGSNIVVYAFTH
jgi:hypothetical protein